MAIANMKVGTRLSLGFGLVLALLLSVALLGVYNMSTIHAKLDSIVSLNVARGDLVQEMSESVHIVARVTRTVVLLTDQAAIRNELAKLQAARANYNKAAEALSRLPATARGLEIRARIAAAGQEARPLTDKVVAMAQANQDAEATDVLMKQAGPATQRWQDVMDEYAALQKENNQADTAAATAAYQSARVLMLALSGLAVAVGACAAVVIARTLLHQLGGEPDYAAGIASRIAAGDLTVSVDTRSGDQHSMLHAMKLMRDALAGIVSEVRSGTETIASASNQIASGNQDLSARTEQQASSLEETASSMEELTSAVRQNNDNARQANQLAQSASAVAQQGGAVVSQVVDTMGAINDSSRKIVDIIAVIDGIAFQTNILALNAAVEAARAGEQGRGFAVVATEVRNLAQRSASAAREIKALIGNSVEKVEIGSKLVEQAGQTMSEVVASVQRVTDIMADISSAGDEQSAGIEQINQAVSEMDTVTQQNAALVEEAAAAAESMQQQAANLERVVGIFQIGAPPRAAAVRPLKTVARQAAAARPLAARPAPKRLGGKVAAAGGDGGWEEF
ncbi:methyl-accepting chemotaxis protein [Janthinobacterium sp. HH01]|uniref:methyl-accepting chemotaxis protein n=1 Tax=Janthinobacterium sp. HH01 TaxID=1198452 RepID=UPI0002AED71D|nr:methyl-accepting chemotaxis protein [Janthinobacterium sp. HH01]ELX13428.1 methyl-accepting chemotaxis protein [Janthinobacterium sp. HH01]